MIEGACHCGGVSWRFESVPDAATACNCTTCRRYGALWIYGWQDEDVFVAGATSAYIRGHMVLAFHFCPTCGSMAYWRSVDKGPDGRRRIAVNVRLSEPESVAAIPIQKFDGLHSFEDLPRNGRRVADLWF
jgi:hypothetical protein